MYRHYVNVGTWTFRVLPCHLARNSYVNDDEMPELPPQELAAAKLYFGSSAQH